VTDWQRNELVAEIMPSDPSRLAVYVARWPGYPGGRAPQVMWRQGNGYDYLPPSDARRFAQALILAAVEAEGGEQP
jgi:hypothetical protein